MDPELLIAVDDARLDLGEGHQEEQQDASIDQVGLGVTVDRVHTELIRDDVSVISRASSRSSSKSVTSERSKRLAKLAAIDVQRKFLEREKQQEKAAKLYEIEHSKAAKLYEIEHSNAAKLLEMEKEAAVAMAELAVFDQFVDEIPDFSNLPQAGPLTSETVPTVLPVQQYQHADPSATDLITRSRNVLNIVDNISSVNSNTANTAVIATANNVMRTDFDQNKITLNSWPKPNLPASNQESNQSILDLSNVLKSHNLPKIELATFNGNPIEFYNWLTTFEQIIEDGTTDPTKRLHYLKQYTSGDANTLVSGFSLYGSSDGYNLAKAELIKEFGNPNVIARSFIDKIEKFKNISSNDNVSMRAFSILLKSCRGSMATSKHLQQLNTDFYLQKVVAKLAVPLQVSWRHHVHRLESNGDVADFNELVKFIDREATVCNHPVYSTCALNPSSTNNHMSKSNVKVAKVAATTAVESKRKPSCPKCSSTHDLEECREYLGLSLDERKKFLIQKHLCFGCLKLTSRSHSVKTCRYKKKCGECSRLHPTSLHDKQFATKSKESKETEPKVVSCLTEVKTQSEKILLSVVLVKLRYENKEVITYAALDSMSSASFISKELWQKIDCPGRKTEITVKTVNGEMKQESAVVTNLSVSSVNATKEISLPSLYVQNSLPIETSDIVSHDILMSYPQLQHLCDEICDLNPSIPIGLLIGVNCPKALEPTQCISSGMYGPCAIKTILGWCVSGPVNSSRSRTTSNNALICNFTSCRDSVLNVKESELPEMIQRMYEYDFVESSISPHLLTGAKTDVSESECEKALSCNDRKFIRLMQNSVRQVNGHYELPLPLIDQSLPNNKVQALKRLRGLRQRFDKDEKYKNDYICFMNEMLEKGYATKSSDEISNSWYIPHHGVYHPRKPNKVRVVFDCSAHHMNTSLNKSLLSGPDLTNSLVGVLLRFRQESIAIMADIESMFYQVKVPEQQQNYLRYLWWPDGDTSKSPEDYQMTVHLFGATSSPSCANFALRQAASDYSSVYGKEAASTLTNNFYVDDMLKSVKDPQTAIKLIKSVKEMCKAGGFHLTKFMCNNGDVLNSVPVEDRAKSVTDVNLIGAASQIETVLGVCWCINNDTLSFRIHLKDSPLTRRGILSTVSSVYDPLGFAAPFLLQGKLLLQELCQKNMGWDDVLDDDTCSKWEKWRKKLSLLQNININRCFKPTEFGNIVSVSVHNFADASQKAYGCCSYLRLVDEDGRIHCSLIMGKSRVAPSKPITIPRLELVAATVAVKINKFVCRELEYNNIQSYFWSDSKAVLGYIRNDAKRFHIFVANRIQHIRENSELESWKYVKSELNPADDASRGIDCKEICNTHRWFVGPSFLWQPEQSWCHTSGTSYFSIQDQDPELKRKSLVSAATSVNSDVISRLFNHHSCWNKLKKAIAWLLIITKQLKNLIKKEPLRNLRDSLSVLEMKHAETWILKYVQSQHFEAELKDLRSFNHVKPSSSIYRLSPILNSDNLLCVGGRLNHGSIEEYKKHPIVLPRNHHITEILVRHYHVKAGHSGKELVMSHIRERFWILGARRIIRQIQNQCFTCRKLYSKPLIQRMADLPTDRLEAEKPPFSSVGVDFFGPFIVKSGRNQLKRYGCIFTCLAIRAVHIEVTFSLETDSFINALQRFISRRGQPHIIRSDNGTNLVGAERELKAAVKEWNSSKMQEFMRQEQIDWKFNPPTASHMGGVWERQIRTTRKILSALMNQQPLTDETLPTLMCIVENIINSRPISPVSDDPNDLEALTPNHLLQPRNDVKLPPGNFYQHDIYSRKRWRQVQYLANVFWSRWKAEYLPTLQSRAKWLKPERNLQINDIVLIKEDNLPRFQWLLGRVLNVTMGSDGLVRSAEVKTNSGEFLRPVHKLCLLECCVSSD